MMKFRFLLLVSIVSPICLADIVVGDTLSVNSKFPSIAFQNAAVDGFHLTTLQDVQRNTAIVFVFASW